MNENNNEDTIYEKELPSIGIGMMLLILLVLLGVAAWLTLMDQHFIIGGILFFVVLFSWSGFTVVEPNTAKVGTFAGNYLGTLKTPGIRYVLPWIGFQTVSIKSDNFTSSELKVNDYDGNPVIVSAVVSYHITSPAEAVFNVDNYEDFIRIQSETSIRHVAGMYPYDSDKSGVITLHGNTDEVAGALQQDLQKRLERIGVTIDDARFAQLSYSTEVASAMLQKQQAAAVLAARSEIVNGSVKIAEDAVQKLQDDLNLDLDDDVVASIVNNIMVVTISGHGITPTIDASAS